VKIFYNCSLSALKAFVNCSYQIIVAEHYQKESWKNSTFKLSGCGNKNQFQSNLIGPRFLTHSAPEETNIWDKGRKNLELHINQHIGEESFQYITSNSENSLKNISKLNMVKHSEKMYLHIIWQ